MIIDPCLLGHCGQAVESAAGSEYGVARVTGEAVAEAFYSASPALPGCDNRIAIAAGTAGIASIARMPHPQRAPKSVKSGYGLLVDAFAINKATLFEMVEKLPGSRVLDSQWGVERHAIAIPKDRDQGIGFVTAFTRDTISTGLITVAIARVGLRGVIGPDAKQ